MRTFFVVNKNCYVFDDNSLSDLIKLVTMCFLRSESEVLRFCFPVLEIFYFFNDSVVYIFLYRTRICRVLLSLILSVMLVLFTYLPWMYYEVT